MKIKLLDTVVIRRDFPEYGVDASDVGVVVEVYEPDGVEVEFVTGAGKTQALITLNVEDVRLIGDADILSVRSLDAA